MRGCTTTSTGREKRMVTGRVEVTSADIARLAGVKPTAVRNWRRRHDDFPEPIQGHGRNPRFDLAQVESWLERQGKAAVIPVGERLWHAFDSARGEIPPEDALAVVGTIMLHLSQHPEAEVPSQPSQ